MTIKHRSSITESGFAGVREYRMHMAETLDDARMGSFIYLADAALVPRGETGLHPHRDVDIVTVMLKGRIAHRGSLGDGTTLGERTIQVQRSGTGIRHNEVNPDDEPNRLLQIWFLPPSQGLKPGYQTFDRVQGETVSVLGSEGTFDNAAELKVVVCQAGDRIAFDHPCIVYVASGRGTADNQDVVEGDLIEADSLAIDTVADLEAIVITQSAL